MIANRPLLASFCAVAFISANLAQAQNSLSPEGQAWLQTTIASGHSDLRWPDFSDYSKHVKKFYDFNGNSLWWVKGLEPTSQARQVITVLQQADQKGLSAGDYDGRSVERPGGETQACCTPAGGGRRGKVRSRAHRLPDAVHIRSPHWQSQSEAFRLRSR